MVLLGQKRDEKRLRAKDVKSGTFLKFTDEGSWQPSTYTDKATGKTEEKNEFMIGCNYNDEEKKVKITVDSERNLSSVYGGETKNWVGKQAMISIKIGSGGYKDSIVLMPIISKDDEVQWS